MVARTRLDPLTVMTSQSVGLRDGSDSQPSRQCAPHHTFAPFPGLEITWMLWSRVPFGMALEPAFRQPPWMLSPIMSHCLVPACFGA